jgi:hypothetical protein
MYLATDEQPVIGKKLIGLLERLFGSPSGVGWECKQFGEYHHSDVGTDDGTDDRLTRDMFDMEEGASTTVV